MSLERPDYEAMRSCTEPRGQINKCTNLTSLQGARYKSEIVCVWRCVASDFARVGKPLLNRSTLNRFVVVIDGGT